MRKKCKWASSYAHLSEYLDFRLWSDEFFRATWSDSGTFDVLRGLVQNMPDGIYAIDMDGNCVFANPAMERLVGAASGQIQTMHSRELFAETDWIELYTSLLHVGNINPVRTFLLAQDGRRIPVELRVFPVFDEGDEAGFFVLVRDQSKFDNERALRQASEERFRWITESSPDVISYSDVHGNLVYVSPSVRNVLGYEPEEMVGKPTTPLFHPDDLQYVDDSVLQIFLGNDMPKFYPPDAPQGRSLRVARDGRSLHL